MNKIRRLSALTAGLLAFALQAAEGRAEKQYGPGVTDTEIKIGQTMPYSGPASAYGTIGKSAAAYFEKVNAEGGVNGRKIRLLSLDDGYSPPKTVEQTRKLVEQEEVLAMFNSLGTATNTAVQKYLNAKKVPQVFLASGATKWGDPKAFPWTMGFQPSYQTEGKLYGHYIAKKLPNAKVAVLYQNDDYGKDYVKGLKEGLGDKSAKAIVSEASYEVTDPTIDSQIITLKSSGADVLIDITTPKFAAQAIRKVYDVGWKPLHIVNNVSASVAAVLTPAGLDKSTGLVSMAYLKDPADPEWANDPAMIEWTAWMKKYFPEGDMKDAFNVYGPILAQTLVQVLKQCGDNLTRENFMKEAANLRNLEIPLLLPGIKVNTSPTDYYPLEQMQLIRFDGAKWVRFGDLLSN